MLDERTIVPKMSAGWGCTGGFTPVLEAVYYVFAGNLCRDGAFLSDGV